MTNETQQITQTTDYKPIPFGSRLKSAREALGLDRKDAAAQLRLTEKVITMMEKDKYPSDLPATFIRGYIRAYGKLLQIPEYEIKKAIEPIQPKVEPVETMSISKSTLPAPVTSSNYFVQLFTYLIVLTMVGLVGVWWYSNKSSNAASVLENPANMDPNAVNAETASPAANTAESPAAAPGTTSAASPVIPVSSPGTAGQPAVNANAQPPSTTPAEAAPATTAKPASPTVRHDTRANASSADDAEEDEFDQNTENSNNTDNTETNSDNAD